MDNKAFITKLGKMLNRETTEVNTLVEGLCRVFKECGSELDSIAVPVFGSFKSEKTEEHVASDETNGKRMLYPPVITMDFQPSIVLRKKLSK